MGNKKAISASLPKPQERTFTRWRERAYGHWAHPGQRSHISPTVFLRCFKRPKQSLKFFQRSKCIKSLPYKYLGVQMKQLRLSTWLCGQQARTVRLHGKRNILFMHRCFRNFLA